MINNKEGCILEENSIQHACEGVNESPSGKENIPVTSRGYTYITTD